MLASARSSTDSLVTANIIADVDVDADALVGTSACGVECGTTVASGVELLVSMGATMPKPSSCDCEKHS